MAAGQKKQFLLLVWKNWIIQKRKILCTVCEICVPILLSVLLVLLRLEFKVKQHDSVTSWDSFQVNEHDIYHRTYSDASKTRSLVYTPDTPWTRAVIDNAALMLDLNATGTCMQLERSFYFNSRSFHS